MDNTFDAVYLIKGLAALAFVIVFLVMVACVGAPFFKDHESNKKEK